MRPALRAICDVVAGDPGAGPLAALPTAVALVPEDWLGDDPEGRRRDLADFLAERLRAPRAFVRETEAARA